MAEKNAFDIEGPVKEAYLALVAAERGSEVAASRELVVPLDRDIVRKAQRALGIEFGPEVLLLFGDLDVFELYDIALSQLKAHQDEADEFELPSSLIPIGRDHDEWVCIERRDRPDEIIIYFAEERKSKKLAIADWLRQVRRQHHQGGQGEGPSDEERRAGRVWARGAKLRVVLSDGEKKIRSLYRVRHPKFGEGVVRREEPADDDRKLEIDFGEGGVRVLMSRFVERIPDK